MATAEYMVTTPPGAYVIPGVGFVGVGSIFQAPNEDYVPSRHFRAINAEAVAGLMKVQTRLREESKKWAAISEKTALSQAKRESAYERSLQLAEQADEMKLDIVALPKEEPKVRPGLSLKEMGERAEFASPLGSSTREKKRAADR